MKTIERAHTPNKLWERVKLSKNYLQALEQIDNHLQYWPNFLIHKSKQRLTKIRQYLIRMRKMRAKAGVKLVGINPKIERRERTREKKALAAASIENKIKTELLDRLKRGIYDGININEEHFIQALDTQEEEEFDEEEAEAEEEEGEVETVDEYVEDLSDMEEGFEGEDFEEEEEDSDEESEEDTKGKKRTKKGDLSSRKKPKSATKGPRVNIEYEQETETSRSAETESSNW